VVDAPPPSPLLLLLLLLDEREEEEEEGQISRKAAGWWLPFASSGLSTTRMSGRFIRVFATRMSWFMVDGSQRGEFLGG
jgi:hypothetical protein